MRRRYACIDSQGNITLLRDVSDDEYMNFNSLSRKISNFLMEVDYYKLFDKAFKEFIAFLEKFLQNRGYMELSDINRYTMNYLLGIKTFLDHWEARIKREYRDDLQYIELFKKATGSE